MFGSLLDPFAAVGEGPSGDVEVGVVMFFVSPEAGVKTRPAIETGGFSVEAEAATYG